MNEAPPKPDGFPAEILLQFCDGLALPACALDPECRVLAANPAFRRLHALLDPPAAGSPLAEILPSLRGTQLEQALCAPPLPGERVEIPGSAATQFLDSLLIGFNGGLLLLHVDRAERRRMDEEHWQLIDSLAHSMRTPLASIRGYAETLQIALAGSSGKSEEYLESIMRLSASLNRTVSDLLYLSRLERGGFADPLGPVDLLHVVRDTLETRVEAAQRAGVKLELLAGEGLPAALASFPALSEVVCNLVDNAIKYTPPGGEVLVTVAARTGMLELTVCDSGIGIPADEQPRVFERFFRASPVRSGNYQGAGLGLSKVQSIVSMLQGRVELSSTEGRGSSFTVLLPPAAAHDSR